MTAILKKQFTVIFCILMYSYTAFTCEKDCHTLKSWANDYITYNFVESSKEVQEIQTFPLGKNLKGISAEDARTLTKKAASVWSSYSNLKLIQVSNASKAQISISEADLQDRKAGNGYLPGNKSINGDIHMDYSERTWTKDLFYKVVLHEMGHAIGMYHNTNKNSIMYHKITKVDKPCELDIAYLQKLYGAENSNNSIRFDADIACHESQSREEIEVTITSVQEIKLEEKQDYTDNSFFKTRGNWTSSMKANAQQNKNQCLRIHSGEFLVNLNSKWNINRSYIFHGTEKVNYLISLDGGITFQKLHSETGTSDPHKYVTKARNSDNTLELSLKKFSGKKAILALEYINEGLFWNTKNHGLHVKNLSLDNVAYLNSKTTELQLSKL